MFLGFYVIVVSIGGCYVEVVIVVFVVVLLDGLDGCVVCFIGI